MSVNINELARKAQEEVTGEKESSSTKQTININGKVYKIKLLSWEDSIDLWEHIMKKVMPSVGAGLDRLQHNELLDGSPTTFTEGFIHLSRNLDGDTFKNFSMVLFEGATVDGEPLKLSEQTSEFLSTWKKLFVFSLKENFKGFFEEGWETGLTDMMTMVAPMMSTNQSEE